MSKILTLGLENLTKFSSDLRRSDFRHSSCLVRLIVWLYYKRPKFERSVGQVDQPNIWNPNKMVRITNTVWNLNCLGMGQLWKAPKSECSDFRGLLYIQSTSEIRTCLDFGQRVSVRFKIASNRLKCLKSERFVRISDTNLCLKTEQVCSNVRISAFKGKCKAKS